MPKYFAALTPTAANPVLTEPGFERIMADADGLLVEKDDHGIVAFYARRGVWGRCGPSAAAAVIGFPSHVYAAELTRAHAEQLLAKLGLTATLPA